MFVTESSIKDLTNRKEEYCDPKEKPCSGPLACIGKIFNRENAKCQKCMSIMENLIEEGLSSYGN